MKNHYLSILTIFASFNILCAQGANDVYSLNIKKIGEQIEITRPTFLNSFNQNGYNNQPYFKNEKSLYLTCQIKGSEQTDIYSLNLYTRSMSKVTETPESEYSPQLHPKTVAFNTVRVEADGTTQRLWEFPTNHNSQGTPLFPDVKNVGYYHWLNKNKVALFLVGDPHNLAIGDAGDSSIKQITSNIGRGFASSTDGDLLYIQKLSENTWYIKKLNPTTGKSVIVVETLKGSEDFILIEDHILMAKGSKIYPYSVTQGKDWKEVVDLAGAGLKNITRMAYNQNRVLVIVDSKS